MNGRPRGRPRGESDLSSPHSRRAGASFGFRPIEESPAPSRSSSASSSLLESPEALTAILLPLPFLFASLAYPSAAIHGIYTRPSIELPDGSPDPSPTEGQIPYGLHAMQACALTAAILLAVGSVSKIQSLTAQPLDRRKSQEGSDQVHQIGHISWDPSAIGVILNKALSVLLPIYAAIQLGGSSVALYLLATAAAGLGSSNQKLGKQSPLDSLRWTMRMRKATSVALVCCMILHTTLSVRKDCALLGHFALAVSIFALPLPLPAAGSALRPNSGQVNGSTMRASLPKLRSGLICSPEDTLLTLIAGGSLAAVCLLYSLIASSGALFEGQQALYLVASSASAAGLFLFSVPSALRSSQKAGLALGSLLVSLFGLYEHPSLWQAWVSFPIAAVLLFGAVTLDTSSALSHSHSHDALHVGQHHAHASDHHLHGNHSKFSAFLIARCTPGSILHSILIEKDSRRIAYFGILNLVFMMVQFFYGFVSGSLGLLTDSIHMLFDCAGLAVGLAAAVMSKWPPNARFPYGYGKIDTLSGFANGVFLMLVSVEIIFDAFERLWDGHELQRLNELLVVSILGFLVNIIGLTAFGHAHHGHGHSHDHGHGEGEDSHGHHHHLDENMHGIFLHILADALGSVAVIVSTVLTKWYGWSGWDPLASCVIAILIFFSAIPLVKSSGMRLLLSLPADVEYGIRNTLQELSSLRGVVGYSVPKFWLEDEGAAHATVHAKELDHDHDHDHEHDSHGANLTCDHTHAHSSATENGHTGHAHSPSNGSAIHVHSHTRSHAHVVHSHAHAHSHSHSHSHSHNHSHSHDHSHDHPHHSHDHSHQHGSAGRQKILGVIHIIAARASDPEDVRDRTAQFLKDKGMDVVVHVEKEGEGRCWCGGGSKTI
ncbi:hypothetical protein M011DRAFT_471036 [Sporormia fimetaria CBS 119925]|uniref:Zinc transporter n=1 Tax=Sporormia fimetaria CBS 119925 TaxID=1340428 RepID=A0A6A6V3N4_9PLEO|nr:hypothetical protein M011DRAFT_471036 [Sporormia fimetaria CBS 119925]